MKEEVVTAHKKFLEWQKLEEGGELTFGHKTYVKGGPQGEQEEELLKQALYHAKKNTMEKSPEGKIYMLHMYDCIFFKMVHVMWTFSHIVLSMWY